MDHLGKPFGSQTQPPILRESVPAVEVPVDDEVCQDDELLSWLQYPLEDSFDKHYCSEELFPERHTAHSNFVLDVFAHLSLREGRKTDSAGLTSLPADLNYSKRKADFNASTAMYSQEIVGHDTNKCKKALAVNAAMAMGAQRAAGLLSQSGVEAFNKVRTNVQPSVSKSSPTVRPIQAPRSSTLNFANHASKAGDTNSRQQSPFQHLAKPNFSLFSRATKTGLKQVSWSESVDAERARMALTRLGKGETAPKCESAADTFSAGLGSSILQACPSMVTAERAIPAHVPKGLDKSSTHSVVLELGPSTSRPFQFEVTGQRQVAHSQDGVSALVAESTTTCLTGIASCKLERDPVGSTNMELNLSIPWAKRRLLSCGSGPQDIETSPKGLPSFGVATTNVDYSMYSELACHDSETSESLINSGGPLPAPFSNKTEVGTGKELEWGPRPLITVSGLTTLEKLGETLEMEDATMASPSRGLGDSTEKSMKEAAALTTKRKVHPAEDSEIESKEFSEGKAAPGRAKRSRAAEMHNLSERKRRNKINVKMKALQDLIPNANKTDKASILDEAIDYMKMLQSQVQLMSIRSGLPMLLPSGMQASPMQQSIHPHLNIDLRPCVGIGAGMFGARHGLVSPTPALGQPLLGTLYNSSGLQLSNRSHAAMREAHGHFQSITMNGAYNSSCLQHQQQVYLLSHRAGEECNFSLNQVLHVKS